MLDIKLIRENPELVKNNLAKRGNPECLQMLDDLIATDKEWRLNLTKLNELRHQRKQVTIEIAKLKKAGKEADKRSPQSTRHRRENNRRRKKGYRQEQKTHDYLMQLRTCSTKLFPLAKTQRQC